jgi:hypothetical protein
MAAFAAAFLVAVLAQDDRPAALRTLAETLSRDGLSGRLAEALGTEEGVQAAEERIDFLLALETGPLERDGHGAWLGHLFSRPPGGDFNLRPERLAEFQALQKRAAKADEGMDPFFRRCDDLVKRIAGDGPLEAKARALWSDREFRIAFFHRHPAELRALAFDDLLEIAASRGVDGETQERLEAVKDYEKAYLQEAAKIEAKEAREALASDAGILFVLGRLLRQQAEGSEIQIGGIVEGDPDAGKPPRISFNLPLAELSASFAQTRLLAAELGKAAEGVADPGLREFLKHPRSAVLVAERLQGLLEDQQRKADGIFDAVLADGFGEEAGRLVVKKGRYVDDQGADSVDALAADHHLVIEEFEGSLRQDLDRVAERAADDSVARLFSNKAATSILYEHRDRFVERAIETIRSRGVDLFASAYLTEVGGTRVVRGDRASRVEALLQRAAAIRKERGR